jgi:hypothetical protein
MTEKHRIALIAVLVGIPFALISVGTVAGQPVTATGDTAPPGGQATVSVTVQDSLSAGERVSISNVPSPWGLPNAGDVDCRNDNCAIEVVQDGSQLNITFIDGGDSATGFLVRFDIPDGARTGDTALDVEFVGDEEQGSDTATVTVGEGDGEPANFEVTIDTNSPVEKGEDLTATISIENTGDQPDTQTVMITGIGSGTQTITLSGGESRIFTDSVPTSSINVDEFTLTVETEDDTATETVIVGGEESSVPSGFPGSNEVFEAIDDDGIGGISPAEMSIAVGEFLTDGTVGGKDVSPAGMSQIVGWFLAQ